MRQERSNLKRLVLPLVAASASVLVALAVHANPCPAQQARHFSGVTLEDGSGVYEKAEVHVRIRDSGGGYSRADYFDANGRRLGFYEAFEVISGDDAGLREWAVRNFHDRTSGAP